MSAPAAPPADSLATPIAWADAAGRLLGCNPAFASWLGVSVRRLVGLALAELDAEARRLAELLPRLPDTGEAVRVRRARLAFPGGTERFAELWLAHTDDGGVRIEVHPADEFPGEDPATLLPAALSAALSSAETETSSCASTSLSGSASSASTSSIARATSPSAVATRRSASSVNTCDGAAA